ncbi:DUF4037 domain-containing protein [Bifidobacterium jacchi]|uniref:DUF4037 domain-containing protein n=2 Tax=Bifidobacterium jacchi TaxID=2490545 RepID=A0A5N5RIR6_9BIFI|nr:DUF4037 domain-containing protein [Bifidobacterium jacchi]
MAPNAAGADTAANGTADATIAGPSMRADGTFDAAAFLSGLDAIFDAHQAATKAAPYLEQAMIDAENAGDDAGLLTVLNETMGFYRSQGWHDKNQWIVQRALELAARMGIADTEAWTTTLINAATAMRAAKHYDQALDLYRQAQASAERTLPRTDRRLAALHNNLSMVYSETGHPRQAEAELRRALSILEQSSPNPDADLDMASTHTNLALVLLDAARVAGEAGGNAVNAAGESTAANAAKATDAPRDTAESQTIGKPNKAGAADTGAAKTATADTDALQEANAHALKALDIYRNGRLEHSAHYASALAGHAQVCYALGDYAQAVERYRQALAVIDECYGRDTDYYRTTEANLREAQRRAQRQEQRQAGRAERYETAHSDQQTKDQQTKDQQTMPFPESNPGATPNPATSKLEFQSKSAAEHSRETNPATNPASQRKFFSGTRLISKNPCAKAPAASASFSRNQGESREELAQQEPQTAGTATTAATAQTEAQTAATAQTKPQTGAQTPVSGLKLAREYWKTYGQPLIAERYPQYRGRIAAGLVGHGSECYSFDDAISRDHDFGPRFCLWLTDDDYAAIGAQLQADYEALPSEFMGCARSDSTPRAARNGANRRDGVFRIGAFFESITGYRTAPPADRPHEWLMLDESTLAAATNGAVFADPLGAFSAARQSFTMMPDDVRLSLISRRLGMMAQSGQYNVPRMLERGDGAAAWLAIGEFVDAAASLVFLINNPVSVGYPPYYKWRFAALRRLSRRMATRLADVCEQLESLLRLSSAACYGGAGFGEGGRGAAPAAGRIHETIEHVCAEVVAELQREGLTDSDETFLEWQRPYVEARIRGTDACLHSM